MPLRFLIPRNKYLASGIHVGVRQHSSKMKEFIYKIRSDGLAIMNLRKIDERIRIAAKMLSKKEKILVATRKPIAYKSLEKFAEIINAKACIGRFMPGSLTNPSYKNYFEAEIVFVTDPFVDRQVVEEAKKARIPIIAICDTNNDTREVDLIIPANNKGKKSIATIFWLLSREILKERGIIKKDSEFKFGLEEFI